MDESKQEGREAIDLTELTGYQFGPDWARSQETTTVSRVSTYAERGMQRRDGGSRGRSRIRDTRATRSADERRNERYSSRTPRGESTDRRPVTANGELPQPASGIRAELRPGNPILSIFSTEILRQKRAHSLMDLARVVMAKSDRYDFVFMKQEDAPMLIHSKREDHSCWLTEEEALAMLPQAPWFSEFYSTEEVPVEPPKGNFTGIAVCTLGNEVIGPVNWHGYQHALTALYKAKYTSMTLGAFRAAISVNKEEEAIQEWIRGVSVRTVWHPTREDEKDKMLGTMRDVEQDFREHHFDDVFESVDKVFINGSMPYKLLSPGLAAYVSIISGKYRHNPQFLIPNLCHGLARHHMPIFKWHGWHYTGPSRIRSVPEGTVLADRMAAILNWSKENSGKKVEEMFAELSGVPSGTDEESKRAAADAYAPYTSDMIWLMEQGYVLVTNDNSIWYPKGEAAPKA